MHTRAKERLVGVDVSDPGDHSLIEQERLDRRPSPPCERAQQRRCEGNVEGLDSESGGVERLERRLADHELARTEATGVDEAQVADAVEGDLDSGVGERL